jgi:exopolysaccharide production protein ExoZ
VLVFGPPAVLIVYALVAAEGTWPRRVPGPLRAVGDASYSLYLIHPTVLALGKWVGVLVPHTPLGHRLWLAGTLAGVIGAGLLFYRRVERPLLTLGKRSRREPPIPAANPSGELVRRAA